MVTDKKGSINQYHMNDNLFLTCHSIIFLQQRLNYLMLKIHN